MLRRGTVCLSATSRIFVLGGHITPFIGKGHPNFIDKKHPDFGQKKNKTLEEFMSDTIHGTLEQTTLAGREELIDLLIVGNFDGELFSNQGHLGPAAVGSLTYARPGGSANPLLHKPAFRVEGACASGGLAVFSAVNALKAQTAKVVLAMGVEVQTTVSPREGGDFLARAAHYARQRGIDDFTFPCLFARRMKAIVERAHFTMEDAARVALKAFSNANKNPLAHMHTCRMTLEKCMDDPKNFKFLGNETYKEFLRVSDCSQVSDGGAGVVLVNEEGLQKLGLTPRDPRLVELKSLACAAGNLFEDPADPTRMDTSGVASRRALEQAGLKPGDLQVAELHDCFSLTEILLYEALGLAEYGKGRDLINNGDTCLDGRIPVNTGGGLLAFGHPVGATGLKQIMEVYRQMKGLCGDYQMKKVPTLGAALNMGGDDKTAVATILENI
ncbi:unnamed protein product [Phytomonas sp. Hart1]|nr:unnamed protein product [Phytomonas sp. Hart1]|eukprot:CCW68279.1 unnamed protein product [Phytomonas sp. isolate Hart1]